MRLGIVSDIHGNLPALEAVVAALHRARVERVICLGDIVGYGPFPDECVERVRLLAAGVVAGNHDLIAVQKPVQGRVSRLARETLEWTRTALASRNLQYLSSLPESISAAPGVLAVHGALDDPSEYVWSAEHARRQLERLGRERPDVRILLVGHTHLPMAYGLRRGLQLHGGRGVVRLDANEPVLLNPGAVGQSRQWRVLARALILDLELGQAQFCGWRYDHSTVGRALRCRGLPRYAYHHRPAANSSALDGLRDLRRALSGRDGTSL